MNEIIELIGSNKKFLGDDFLGNAMDQARLVDRTLTANRGS